jgi:predicted  nucleic acid-binding Zn-ribbon protein
MPDFSTSEEKIKQSFQKVKEDINDLNKALEGQKNDLKDLKLKIDEIYNFISKIKEDLDTFKKSSIGNEGVINDQQQSTTINNAKQTTTNNQQQTTEVSLQVTQALKRLTDREFSVLVAMVELERQLPEITYTDLATKLKISEPTVRNVINALISKKIPIQKNRFFNKKVSLLVNPSLKTPSFLEKLVQLRNSSQNQKTLFETVGTP